MTNETGTANENVQVEPTGSDQPVACPNCGAAVAPDQSFCEACGFELTPLAAPPAVVADPLESPITLSAPVHRGQPSAAPAAATAPTVRPCQSCGGVVGADGYCETCGTKAVSERDHYTEQPASWVAAVCDRGIRHHRNEDATAIAADPTPGSRAVLVVCDGVSTSLDSDVASLAGARAARDVLVTQQPVGLGLPASRAAATANALHTATTAANTAVVANTAADSDNSASCTFAAAVIEGDLIVFGNVGDSRVYWLPDLGEPEPPAELSLDDSVAQFRISAGVPRVEAENGPQAHAITKWLGRDSPDFAPRTGSLSVASAGWLMVCSDGLWNYCSEATDLQALVAELAGATAEPLPLADALVGWANAQGGKDNISVALARHVGPTRPLSWSDTAPSEPAPTDPATTDSAPTDRAPTDPAPRDPTPPHPAPSAAAAPAAAPEHPEQTQGETDHG